MIGEKQREEPMFYYVTMEDMVPEDHLLRLVDKHIDLRFIRRQVIYTYNGDLLTGAANPVNETTTYGYDPATYDLLTIKNNNNEIYVTNTYDSHRRVATQQYGNRTFTFNYDNDGDDFDEILSGETLVTEGTNITTYYYNTSFGFITKVIDPNSRETLYDWDILTKQLLSITDPLGNITGFDYYADAKLWKVTQDFQGPDEKITAYAYYDGTYAEKLESVTDPEGLKTTYTYTTDGKANLSSIEDPYGNITYYETYNSNGQVTRIKDANGKFTDIAYDQYGYIDNVTDPLGRITDYTSDSVGNRTQVKDALLRTTDYVYDTYSRLDYVTDHQGHITDYDYDLNGNLKTVTDARGHDTHYEYNELNQLIYIKDHFLNTKTEYIYDNNNLWKAINARGGWIEYTYDSLNRVDLKTLYDDTGAVEDVVDYTYDDSGRLLTADNYSADLTLNYDNVNRLISVTTGGAMPAFTINYDYFGNDKRYTMTDITGTTTYSLPERLPLPSDPVTETLTTPNMGTFTITYDNLMRRDDMTLGNGIVTDYQYDDASQLTLLEYLDGVTSVTSHQYPLYDNVGNRKQEIDINGTHDFDYDELYRLTSADHPETSGNPAESFTYTDPVGSVGNRTDSHLSSSYTYDDLNRLQSDDEYTYGYDADGNLVLKTATDSSYTNYYYNAENKLTGVDIYDSTPTLISSVSYAYDGFGRRVKKDVDGVVKYYIYDNEDIRFETDNSGNIVAEYTHGSGIDEPLSMRRNNVNYFYHVNGLGTVTALTDSSKAVVQEYVYDSFGQIISQTGTITNPYTYTAREYDSDTGLYYYRARYYDASVGRFVSEDPIGISGGINLFLYVGNNSINRIDPEGKTWWILPVACAWGAAYAGCNVGLFMYCLETECKIKLPRDPIKDPPINWDCVRKCFADGDDCLWLGLLPF